MAKKPRTPKDQCNVKLPVPVLLTIEEWCKDEGWDRPGVILAGVLALGCFNDVERRRIVGTAIQLSRDKIEYRAAVAALPARIAEPLTDEKVKRAMQALSRHILPGPVPHRRTGT